MCGSHSRKVFESQKQDFLGLLFLYVFNRLLPFDTYLAGCLAGSAAHSCRLTAAFLQVQVLSPGRHNGDFRGVLQQRGETLLLVFM